MNHSPKRVGFLQALALAAYIGFFATNVFRVQEWIQAHGIAPHPIAGIMFFLLAFVISALISASVSRGSFWEYRAWSDKNGRGVAYY
ncbi:MAG: hypothetical protein HY007_01845 [Candidatus Sungbacteria bacterium]|nr:hypothetical protein [Candidatus Sungbacteria bacterium]